MSTKYTTRALAFAAAVATVSAHGHLHSLIIDGLSYPEWDLGESGNYLGVGWAGVPDDGPVTTSAYASNDIICGKDATNAPGHAVVAAGGSVFVQYDVDQDDLGQEWPRDHKGPIIDMLAACPDTGCEKVDKTSLEFFKIAEAGLIGYSSGDEAGTWATDTLVDQGSGWRIVIPESIKPGFYVLRHEIIALHNAPNDEDGAQNYPFCSNIEITGKGTYQPAGVKATTMYHKTDPGIDISIYSPLKSYTIPGPALDSSFSPVTQSVEKATGEGKVITSEEKSTGDDSGDSSGTQPTTTKASAAPTTKAASAPTSTFATMTKTKSHGSGHHTTSHASKPTSTGTTSSDGDDDGDDDDCEHEDSVEDEDVDDDDDSTSGYKSKHSRHDDRRRFVGRARHLRDY